MRIIEGTTGVRGQPPGNLTNLLLVGKADVRPLKTESAVNPDFPWAVDEDICDTGIA
jgi:hypothetical protein